MATRDAIVHEVFYPYPIDNVWDALTDPEQLALWLMENDFSASKGQQFMFYDHEPWPDGKVYDIECRIVRCDPPYRLAYTWSSLPKHGPTLVEWELSELARGTRVRLTHSGFSKHGSGGVEARDMYQGGWAGLLRDELQRHLAKVAVSNTCGETQLPG